MVIASIKLLNFKNYAALEVGFCNGLNCFTGLNGVGKTNLMDALYYSCFTKSYFNASDKHAFKLDSPYFKIVTTVETANNQVKEIVIKSKLRNSKEVSVDGVVYEKFTEFIGKFPAVMVAPDDNTLILGGSVLRRKFLDGCLSQIDHDYLDNLMEYNRWLKKRNAYLKSLHSSKPDDTILDVYDSKLVPLGTSIHERRKVFLSGFAIPFQKNYTIISENSNEQIEIEYQSDLQELTFGELLMRNRKKDCVLQRTSVGIHQDDLLFKLNGIPIKKIGSQGQQKSLLIAMKLAQYEIMTEHIGFKPVLFLDDIFDKFDEERLTHLIELLNTDAFGQVFITDTHLERIIELGLKFKGDCRIFKIIDGFIEQI